MSSATLLLLGQEAEALAPRLEASGYQCRVGIEQLQNGCDLAVLGAELAEQLPALRERLGTAPILLDIGHDSVAARSGMLRSGATDFWLSSAGASDLLMRLRLHRKLIDKGRPEADRLNLGDLSLIPSRHEVRRGQRLLALTAREYALLQLLMEHSGQVLSRDQILRQVWHDQRGAASNVIEVYVRYLRQKLEEHGEKRLIHTVRGQGYCLSNGPPPR
ncbi:MULTISPECIES: winged helix-turn-helix transcriptional regulator [unclassified Synechococcus]|jgi:DNA-binding response OmpR family regulator|uniref:winged helix-turn-helix transcriptional regulator n=1 Tax=Synechococcaceae TaxID=1890426 RepID=UPI001BDDB09A|nr:MULTISPECIES: response regulator transcription factor [unclassified Synechococcus]QVV67660.1 response regulator transcription factor [Synechococcus sp. LA31]CAK6693872.1 Response regulator MprA [Synechococcus sp. CBW1107]